MTGQDGAAGVIARPGRGPRPVSTSPSGCIENAGFEVTDVQGMREHYVRTIRAWLGRMGLDQILAIRKAR